MVEWVEKVEMAVVGDFLEGGAAAEEVETVGKEELGAFFRQHHCHRGLRERRILAIGGAIPAGVDRAVSEAKSTVVKVMGQLIRTLLQGIAGLARKIEGTAAEHPAFVIL